MSADYYALDDEKHLKRTTAEEWARMYELGDRTVEKTDISKEVHVSTVFLGLDHRHIGKGPPLVFETMIFGGPLDGYQWRYSSWDDAVTGHAAAVRKARRG